MTWSYQDEANSIEQLRRSFDENANDVLSRMSLADALVDACAYDEALEHLLGCWRAGLGAKRQDYLARIPGILT